MLVFLSLWTGVKHTIIKEALHNLSVGLRLRKRLETPLF